MLSIKCGLVYLLIYYVISTASELGPELKIIILVGSQFFTGITLVGSNIKIYII